MTRLFALIILVCAAHLVFAQRLAILVQPISVEVQPRAGDSIRVPVNIRNTSIQEAVEVEALVWPLYQNDEARFFVEEPDASKKASPPPGQSCEPWTTLSAERLTIPAAAAQDLFVQLKVPSNARGVYSAALIVQSIPNTKPGAIGIRVRFLIPILVHIYGNSATRRVSIIGANISHSPKAENEAAGTLVAVEVSNTGESLAKATGKATIFAQMGTNWRKVATVQLPERRFLPTVQAYLSAKTPVRLPKGKYRVVADITIDGARYPQLTKEVDYAGDPEAGTLLPEAELGIAPSVIEVTGTARSTRTTTIAVRNNGTEAIIVSPTSATPKALDGVAIGNRFGDQLSGASWTSFGLEEVAIPPGQERKVRIQVAIPDEAKQPFYYTDIIFRAKSADGTPLGEASSLLIVKNSRKVPESRLEPSGRVTLTAGGPNIFNVVARFANTGDMHLDPKGMAQITDRTGLRAMLDFEVSRPPGLVLPFGTASYTGTMDIKSVPPGEYVLRIVAQHAGGKAEFSVPVSVSGTGSAKKLTILQPKPAGGGK